MHTSTRLVSTDFQFWQWQQGERILVDFATFCPDYHELDRVGVVSPRLEDGVLYTAYSLLALTTTFYDWQRRRGGDFFTYPQHFALVGADESGIQSTGGSILPATAQLWDAWSWLDVWPACKWITVPPTATSMVQQIFDLQINRLFWPQTLTRQPDEPPLPDYVRNMLASTLKTVYYYPDQHNLRESTQSPLLEIHAQPAAIDLVQASIAMLPCADAQPTRPTPATERLQPVAVLDFLNEMLPPSSQI